MQNDDGILYIVSSEPLRLEHIHSGRRVEFSEEVIGTEASANGRRELIEHSCLECGTRLVAANPVG